jgi:peptidoglycan LD-endopeptidase CwlK
MPFVLSAKSLSRLGGIHPDMVKVVKTAIEYTDVDFGVGIGLRTEEEQAALFAKGASQTMKSKHLRQSDGFGHAVDLFAYMNGNVDWSITLYDNVADAMKKAARNHQVHIRWGGLGL